MYLQVHTQKALLFGVLKVVLHEEVEQACCFTAYAPQFGHATLKHLVTQRATQGHAALKERHLKLRHATIQDIVFKKADQYTQYNLCTNISLQVYVHKIFLCTCVHLGHKGS